MLLGVDYFSRKPFDLDLLSERIRSLTQVASSAHSQVFSSVSPSVATVKSEHNIVSELTLLMHQLGIPAQVEG